MAKPKQFTIEDLKHFARSIPEDLKVEPTPQSGKEWVEWYIDLLDRVTSNPLPIKDVYPFGNPFEKDNDE